MIRKRQKQAPNIETITSELKRLIRVKLDLAEMYFRLD